MNTKKKGNRGENELAKYLQSKGVNAHRDSASGGGSREAGDIINDAGLSIEVKTVKKINLQEAWRQAKSAGEKQGNTPTLWIHFDGMPKGKWLVVVDCDDFMDMLTKDLK